MDRKNDERKLICFICTANICRSPMAEAILNYLDKENKYFAVSAGIFPQEGQPIAPRAVKALEQGGILPSKGVDFHLHKSVKLTENIIKEAYSVYAMSKRTVLTLGEMFPKYTSKISFVGNVGDPHNGSINEYIKCRKYIETKIRDEFGLYDE